MQDEFQYIVELQNGNGLAFNMLYAYYHERLYVYSLKYLRNREEACDVVQNTFLRIWEIRKNIDPTIGLERILFTIAKRMILNIIRSKSLEMIKLDSFSKRMRENTDAEKPYDFETIAFLRKHIMNLSSRKAEVCLLKIGKGLSNREIATELGISVNTVKVLYRQAIQHLKIDMNAIG